MEECRSPPLPIATTLVPLVLASTYVQAYGTNTGNAANARVRAKYEEEKEGSMTLPVSMPLSLGTGTGFYIHAYGTNNAANARVRAKYEEEKEGSQSMTLPRPHTARFRKNCPSWLCCRIVHIHIHIHIDNHSISIIMTCPQVDQDEFEDGDDSFWANLDVDAMVNASPGPAPKRAKISPERTNATNGSTTFSESQLQDCLEQYFGFRSFRSGQVEAIQAILQGKDTAVFWATGSGKSLVYTLPPLLLGTTALIVSPLISLMQDQVHKLNGLVQENTTPLATYLGSAQRDPTQEPMALQGKFRLVFCTPEKLQSNGFLESLATRVQLCLIAMDEAHCVRYVHLGAKRWIHLRSFAIRLSSPSITTFWLVNGAMIFVPTIEPPVMQFDRIATWTRSPSWR